MTDSVVFLCGSDELDKERRGYFRAFDRRFRVVFIAAQDGVRWLDSVATLRPFLVLHPDGRWWLPDGIERAPAVTAAFHIDTFAGPRRRVAASSLYDHVFLFHPGFGKVFAHPGAHLLPHAADAAMLKDPHGNRDYDVAWVGHRGRSIYRRRDQVLETLSSRFHMNDTSRSYSPEEMAALYGNARVVVNVSRDDWPQDANMRCFEAMAAGALLVTRVPTELTDFGFREGVHFVGYRDDESPADVTARCLRQDEARLAIAAAGHELVAREHTYDARVSTIVEAVQTGSRAPARGWPQAAAARRHFDLHVEQGDSSHALFWFRRIRKESFGAAVQAAPRLIRLAAKVARRVLTRRRAS